MEYLVGALYWSDTSICNGELHAWDWCIVSDNGPWTRVSDLTSTRASVLTGRK
jgi:hypothetical protein